MGEPAYVTEINAKENQVRIGTNQDLEHVGLVADNINWIAIDNLHSDLEVEAKIRYNDPGVPATIRQATNGRVEVIFRQPQRAVTPGQSVVFYQDDSVLGGGIIQAVIKNESDV